MGCIDIKILCVNKDCANSLGMNIMDGYRLCNINTISILFSEKPSIFDIVLISY